MAIMDQIIDIDGRGLVADIVGAQQRGLQTAMKMKELGQYELNEEFKRKQIELQNRLLGYQIEQAGGRTSDLNRQRQHEEEARQLYNELMADVYPQSGQPSATTTAPTTTQATTIPPINLAPGLTQPAQPQEQKGLTAKAKPTTTFASAEIDAAIAKKQQTGLTTTAATTKTPKGQAATSKAPSVADYDAAIAKKQAQQKSGDK
jgi:hypothetical protein